MVMEAKNKKIQFLLRWLTINGIVIIGGIILSYVLGFIIFFGPMGYSSYEDTGTPLEQTLMMIGGCLLTGLGIGFFQWKILNRVYKISVTWLFTIPAGCITVEVIAGISGNYFGSPGRGGFDYMQNVLIFSGYGLIVGTIQFFILRKIFKRAVIWILSNILAFGLGMLVAGSVAGNSLMILTYLTGIIFYGVTTGATLMWIFIPGEINEPG